MIRMIMSATTKENTTCFIPVSPDGMFRLWTKTLSNIVLYCWLVVVAPLVLSQCPNDCVPNGFCGDNGICNCDSGYAGADCSFPFEQCPDGIMTCFNGAKCRRFSMRQDVDKSSYECDCSSVEASQFQIEECENPESEVCEEGQLQSEYAFCTNGGKCIAMIRHGEPHSGCICDEEFEGRHCQYRKGEAPDVELKLAYEENRSNISIGLKFFITIVSLGVILIFGASFFKKTEKKNEKEWLEPTDALSDVDLEDSVDESEVTEASEGVMT